MRPALTIGAAVLVLVAALLLGLPALIDRQAVQDELGRLASRLTGQTMTIDGRLDINLLPSPTISLGRVTLRGDAMGFTGDIDRVDLAVDLLGLLRGKLAVRELRLVRPVMRLELAGGEALSRLVRLLSAEAAQAIEHGSVVDGRLELTHAGGEMIVITSVGATLDAEGGVGADGAAGARSDRVVILTASADGQPLSLGAKLARPRNDGLLPIELQIAAGANRLGFSGEIGAGMPSIAGEVQLASGDLPRLVQLAWPGMAAGLPETLAITGKITVDDEQMRIEAGSLAMPQGALRVDARLERSASPKLVIEATGERIEIDDAAPMLATLDATATALPPELEASVALRVGTLGWHGLELQRLDLEAALDGQGTGRITRLTATLPGSGTLDVEGNLAPAERRLDGRITVSTRDLPLLLAPGGSAGRPLPAVLPRDMLLESRLALDLSGIALRDMRLRLADSLIQGGIAYATGAPRPQLAASLHIDRLDLDALRPGLANLAAQPGWRSMAKSSDHALDLAIDGVSGFGLRASGLALKSKGQAGHVSIEELSIGDLAGTTARLNATIDGAGDGGQGSDRGGEKLTLGADLAITSLSRLLRAAGVTPPLALSLLGPIDIATDVQGTVDTLQLTAGVDASSIKGEISASGNIQAFESTITLRAEDTRAMLGQIGALVLDHPSAEGGGALTIALARRTDASLDATLDLHLGTMSAQAKLAAPAGAAARLELETEGVDGRLAASVYRWLGPMLGMPATPPDRWLGALPTQALAWHWPLPQALDLSARFLGPDGHAVAEAMAQLDDLGLEQGSVTLPLGQGKLTTTLAWRGDRLSGDARLDRADLGALLELLGVVGAPGGQVTAALPFTARGGSIAELVSRLTGFGDVEVEQLALAPAFEGLKGRLRLDHGILRGQGLELSGSAGDAPLELMVDLGAWMIEAEADGSHIFGPPTAVTIRAEDPTSPPVAPAHRSALP